MYLTHKVFVVYVKNKEKKMKRKENAFPADLGDDIDGQKRVQMIYLNSIALAISNNCKPLIKQFRRPNDTIAERIAQQIVADFILSHNMAVP